MNWEKAYCGAYKIEKVNKQIALCKNPGIAKATFKVPACDQLRALFIVVFEKAGQSFMAPAFSI
jgi:hypothetical protein